MKSIPWFLLCCMAWICLIQSKCDAFRLPSLQRDVRNSMGFRVPSFWSQFDDRITQRVLCAGVLPKSEDDDDKVLDSHRHFRTTSELLAELDQRNLRYPPTATRDELERLLTLGQNESNQVHVAWLAEQLMAMGIRIPRYASRDDLEQLLQDALQNPDHLVKASQTRRDSEQITKQRKQQHMAIARLRKELDELGIPYPPKASPRVLERLRRERDFYPEAAASSNEEEPYRKVIGKPRKDPSPSRVRRTKRPSMEKLHTDQNNHHTRELMAELGRRKIRFSPTATQNELAELLYVAEQKQAPGHVEDRRKTSKHGNEIPETRAADFGHDTQDQTTSFNQNQETEMSKPLANAEEGVDRKVEMVDSEGIQDDLHGSHQDRRKADPSSRQRAAGLRR